MFGSSNWDVTEAQLLLLFFSSLVHIYNVNSTYVQSWLWKKWDIYIFWPQETRENGKFFSKSEKKCMRKKIVTVRFLLHFTFVLYYCYIVITYKLTRQYLWPFHTLKCVKLYFLMWRVFCKIVVLHFDQNHWKLPVLECQFY